MHIGGPGDENLTYPQYYLRGDVSVLKVHDVQLTLSEMRQVVDDLYQGWVAVPEPSAGLVAAPLGILLLARRRRVELSVHQADV